MQMLKYRQDDGQIVGLYTSPLREHLEANRIATDPMFGYVVTETHLVLEECDRCEVRNGEVMQKMEIVLCANTVSFRADGVEECIVTVVPFVPCTFMINEHEVPIIAEDDPLLLTSDLPQVFQVTLRPMPEYWAVPLMLEAR